MSDGISWYYAANPVNTICGHEVHKYKGSFVISPMRQHSGHGLDFRDGQAGEGIYSTVEAARAGIIKWYEQEVELKIDHLKWAKKALAEAKKKKKWELP